MRFDEVLDEIVKLDFEEQKLLLDIVQKRLVDLERDEIKGEFEKHKLERDNGKHKPISVKEFFDRIEAKIV